MTSHTPLRYAEAHTHTHSSSIVRGCFKEMLLPLLLLLLLRRGKQQTGDKNWTDVIQRGGERGGRLSKNKKM